jgi:hypothetical protein
LSDDAIEPHNHILFLGRSGDQATCHVDDALLTGPSQVDVSPLQASLRQSAPLPEAQMHRSVAASRVQKRKRNPTVGSMLLRWI